MQVDATSGAYRADLAACRQSSEQAVNQDNARRALRWVASSVTRWGQIGDATGSCMAGKGYGRLRWCTDEELAQARRTGTAVVTASGVQCSEPPKR